MTGPAEHWDQTYSRSGAAGVSWTQDHPGPAINCLDALGVDRSAAVVDVGGGTSAFSEDLLERGFQDITIIDLSAEAVRAGKKRIGERAVTWLQDDVLDWRPTRAYELWHDRAVFHFFLEDADRSRYRETLRNALAPGGAVIVETFADDGPTRCSGLPVTRYSESSLAREFDPGLVATASGRYEHRTPSGTVQPFVWLALRSQ